MDVREYFQSHEDYFWEWTTDQDVPDETGYHENNLISIPNVGAVVYRPFLIEVLKEFQLIGLPPLTPFLLVLYATNEGYLDLKSIKTELRKNPLVIHEHIKHSIRFLDFLVKNTSLSEDFKMVQNHYLTDDLSEEYIKKGFLSFKLFTDKGKGKVYFRLVLDKNTNSNQTENWEITTRKK